MYSGSQKCLSAPPGLSPVTLSPRALSAISRRSTPVQSWFLDFTSLMNYWSGNKRAYHHSAPVNAIYGLRQSLLILREEGLEAAWTRHRESHEALAAGLEDLGLALRVEPAHRLPQLNVVSVPEGIDDDATRTALLEAHRLEIGAGLGELAGKVRRIGLMGCGADASSVNLVLNALADVLGRPRGVRGASPARSN